jgi:hypothetical protein
VENIADHGKFFMLAERKKGCEEKGGKGKKEKKEKERKERKRVTAPISSHFVQGQTLGVGGAPKIIYERTLIAECSLICRVFPLCWLCIIPLLCIVPLV